MRGIEVIHGDCREALASLPVDLPCAVIADPPYGIDHETNFGASWEGTRIANDHDTALRDWIIGWAEARRAPWACFGTWKAPRPANCRGVLVWDKGPAFGMGDLSFPWKASWEEIYVGGPGWIGRRDEGVLRGHLIVSWESKGRKHPHQKPVSLISHLIGKLPEELAIIDPTAGSGSTLVACAKAGRRGIGIESDAGYIPTIQLRLRDAATPIFDRLESAPLAEATP